MIQTSPEIQTSTIDSRQLIQNQSDDDILEVAHNSLRILRASKKGLLRSDP